MNMDEHNSEISETESIESLRQILEAEQGRPFTYEEALEVGQSLINFFEVLADRADASQVPCPAQKIEAAPQVRQQTQQLLLI